MRILEAYAAIGDLQRFFETPKWDWKHKRYRTRTLREVEDAVARLAGLWLPHSDSGDFVAEDRRLAKTGNRYLRYYLVQAANGIPAYACFYSLKFRQATRHKHKRSLILTARKSVGLFVGLATPQGSRSHTGGLKQLHASPVVTADRG